jgi:hypothetical protein
VSKVIAARPIQLGRDRGAGRIAFYWLMAFAVLLIVLVAATPARPSPPSGRLRCGRCG